MTRPRDVRRISLDIGTPTTGRAPTKGCPAGFAVASVVRVGARVPNDLMLVAG
jgi:hypothetical protein